MMSIDFRFPINLMVSIHLVLCQEMVYGMFWHFYITIYNPSKNQALFFVFGMCFESLEWGSVSSYIIMVVRCFMRMVF